MALPEVFISYSSRDVSRVRDLAGALEGAGVTIWRDQDQILGGQNYGPKIVHGIKNAKALLLACSPASMRSKNVKQEIQLAWTYDVPYLPVILESTPFPEQVEYWLSGSQFVRLLDRSPADILPDLLRSLLAFGVGPELAVPDPARKARLEEPDPVEDLWRLARFSDLFWPVPAQAEAARRPRLRDLGAPQTDAAHRFNLGTRLRLRLDSPKPGHLTVIDFGTTATTYLLCPSDFAPETWIEAGPSLLPQSASRYAAFEASGKAGREQVMAIVSDDPIGWEKKAQPGHPATLLTHADLSELARVLRARPPDTWMAFATYFDIG